MCIRDRFDDEVKLSDDAKNATDTRPNEAIPFSFEIRSWNEYMDNISKWQKENARDQWVDAKYSNKPL